MSREHPCQGMLALEHSDEITFQNGLLTIAEPGEDGQYIEIQLPPLAVESLTRQIEYALKDEHYKAHPEEAR